MPKEPLYPHVPKGREPQFPHVPKGQQPAEKLPQTLPQTGTCYADAWRFLIKEEEGELIHGTVFSGGRRMGHAWVETPTGWVFEPETGSFFTASGFKDAFAPVIEARYTAEESAIMLARTKHLGPWSEQERLQYLGVRQPQTVPKRTILTFVCAYCGKYITKKPGYGVSVVSHGICKECAKIEWEKLIDHIAQKRGISRKEARKLVEKQKAEARAAEQPGAKLTATEKLYQRGPDEYPIGADKIMRDAWGPMPDPDQPFWSGKGFVKPVKIYGWQWSPDYHSWRAYVRFPDGTETWTSPLKQTGGSLERLASTEGDPIRKFCCRQCGECAPKEFLEEGKFLDRISWLRSHYKEKHPGMWGKRLPLTVEDGEPVSPEYRHLVGLVSEPLPKEAY
jgi:hypothetical protein